VGIFHGFFGDHVDDIIVGDDAEHAMFVVDHGDCQQIVFGNLPGHFLLVVGHVDCDQIPLHDLAHRAIGEPSRGEELSRRHQPVQMAFLIKDVDVVNGFQLLCLASDMVQGLFHWSVVANSGELRGHLGAGRILRESLQPLDVASLFGGDERHDLFDDFRIDFLEKVDTIVGGHLADQLGGLFPIERFEDLDLQILVEEGEDLSAQEPMGMSDDFPRLSGGQAVHELNGSGGVQSSAEFAQAIHVVVGEHFAKFGQVEGVRHGSSLRLDDILPSVTFGAGGA
jgi:hypothetical protein